MVLLWTDELVAKADADVSVVETEADVIDADADDDVTFDVVEDEFFTTESMDFSGLTLPLLLKHSQICSMAES